MHACGNDARPSMGRLFDQIIELQVSGHIRSRADAIGWVDRNKRGSSISNFTGKAHPNRVRSDSGNRDRGCNRRAVRPAQLFGVGTLLGVTGRAGVVAHADADQFDTGGFPKRFSWSQPWLSIPVSRPGRMSIEGQYRGIAHCSGNMFA